MTATETAVEVLRVDIGRGQSAVIVPAVRVTVMGAKAEVSGYVHVVVYGSESTTVHHYEILVESWTTDIERDDLQRTIEYIAARARSRAEEYVNALKLLTTLNVEINFRDGLANRSWLPTWLQRYLE